MIAGCTSVKDEIGLSRVKPDEFAVVPKAPLAMPPDFTSLPKPKPGAPRPQQISASGEARAALGFAKAPAAATPVQSTLPSAGELALIEAAGAANANANVKEEMITELREAKNSPSMTEQILFWQGNTEEVWVVDAAAEARRIERAKKKGEAVTGHDTPIIEKSAEKGLVGSIF
jgi:hypothetical protein